MSVINAIKKQNNTRLLINFFVYGVIGGLFAYGAIYKFGGSEERLKGFYLYSIFMVASLGYALYNLLQILSKAYLRSYKKSLKLYGVSELITESDFADSVPFHQVMFGRRNMVYTGKKPFLIPYDNILWVYIHFRQDKKGDLPRCYLNICDDKKNKYVIRFLSNDIIQDVLSTIKEKAPYAYYGDVHQHYNLYTCSFDEMVENVRKAKGNQ